MAEYTRALVWFRRDLRDDAMFFNHGDFQRLHPLQKCLAEKADAVLPASLSGGCLRWPAGCAVDGRPGLAGDGFAPARLAALKLPAGMAWQAGGRTHALKYGVAAPLR